MELDEIRELIGDAPNMKLGQAQALRQLAVDYGLADFLELGFAHGVGTCYLLSIAEEVGGSVVSIDLEEARGRVPSAVELLDRCGLLDKAELFYEPTSYTWRLMKFLEADPTPRFDLCYVDARHDWFVDGFGFFLVDRLLRPGGWIVFDDLPWTFAASPTCGQLDWVKAMPVEERETPQIRKVFDLLVKTHPGYGEFREEGAWGFARKQPKGYR